MESGHHVNAETQNLSLKGKLSHRKAAVEIRPRVGLAVVVEGLFCCHDSYNWCLIGPFLVFIHKALKDGFVKLFLVFTGQYEPPRLAIETACSPSSSFKQRH